MHLMEPERTSPAANRPGRLVSSNKAGHDSPGSEAMSLRDVTFSPVRTKPFGIWSRDARDGQLIHHSDEGSNDVVAAGHPAPGPVADSIVLDPDPSWLLDPYDISEPVRVVRV
jgi:hypothetical protein